MNPDPADLADLLADPNTLASERAALDRLLSDATATQAHTVSPRVDTVSPTVDMGTLPREPLALGLAIAEFCHNSMKIKNTRNPLAAPRLPQGEPQAIGEYRDTPRTSEAPESQ